jgi:hypothetical protein
MIPSDTGIPSNSGLANRAGLFGRTSENSLNALYECGPSQGFEASGCLLRLLVAASVYQAALRQSIKGGLRPQPSGQVVEGEGQEANDPTAQHQDRGPMHDRPQQRATPQPESRQFFQFFFQHFI